MKRTLYAIVFLLLTTSIYGQKSTLLQNINVRAKELKHRLNKTEDSLILEGERTIYKVEIFNKDYEQSLIVKDSKVIIPLNKVPVGRFVVEAALPDKLIVITLLRNELIRPTLKNTRAIKKTSLFTKAPAQPEQNTINPLNKVIETKLTEAKLAKVNKTSEVVAYNNLAQTDNEATIVERTTIAATKKATIKGHKDKVNLTEAKAIIAKDNELITYKNAIAATKKAIIKNHNEVVNLTETKEIIAKDNEEITDREKAIAATRKAIIKKRKDDLIAKERKAIIAKNNVLVKNKKETVVSNKKTTILNNEKLITAKNVQNNSGHKVVEAYWVEYQANNPQSSSKLRRLADEALVDKMISKINLDKRTKAGKHNELIIWEVYNTTKFLKYKMKNKNNLSSEAACFNAVPFFNTIKEPSAP